MFDALLRLPGGLCRTTRALGTHHYLSGPCESLKASVKSWLLPPFRSGCSTKPCTTPENAGRIVAKLWRGGTRRPIVTPMRSSPHDDLIASVAPAARAVTREADALAF